jgi:ribosomal protein S18 acetylase RimI-like enzyme
VEHLAFDSDLFGIQVYRASDMPAADDLENCDLLYLTRTKPLPADLLELHQGRLIDRKRTYTHGLNSKTKPASTARAGLAIKPIQDSKPSQSLKDRLSDLACQAGVNSRFKVDPNLPERLYEKMIRTWMSNSITGALAYTILLAWRQRELVGFVSLQEAGANRSSIGLVGVDRACRDQGFGTALMAAAITHVRQVKKHEQLRVTTHGQNERLCRFYEGLGFEEPEELLVYHFWPKGPRFD